MAKRPFLERFEIFIHRLKLNAWFEHGTINIYCRRTWRMLDKQRQVIDIANVNLGTELGKGMFTRLLTALESDSPIGVEAIYIENVFDSRFQKFFENRGYTKIQDSGTWPPSYYRLV